MPSVTEVLDYSTPPALVKWFKNNTASKCDAIGRETARIGSLVDSLIQQDINDGGYVPPAGDQQALFCLEGWEALKKDHPGFVPSVKEMQVELEVGDIKGHPDYICIEDCGSKWGITDLKCTSGIRDKNWVQVAKYAQMVMNIREYSFPSFLRVIRLPRENNKYEWKEVGDENVIKYLIGLFDSYLAVFKSEKIINEYFRLQLEEEFLK